MECRMVVDDYYQYLPILLPILLWNMGSGGLQERKIRGWTGNAVYHMCSLVVMLKFIRIKKKEGGFSDNMKFNYNNYYYFEAGFLYNIICT